MAHEEEREERGVKARELERREILKAGTAYRMAKAGLIPCRRVGAKSGGVEFNPAEVIAALKGLAATKIAGTPKDAA